MKKIAKSQSFLIVVQKNSLYLQRNERSNGITRVNNFAHLGHVVVTCLSEAVQRRFGTRSPFVFHFFVVILTIALYILPQRIEAQDGVEGYKSLIPQAPDAQALARAIDIPVNAYTGIPQISIPLYEINIGELTIPITLSYHAGGILANQEATEVGLGWSLLAGGSITRTIKCIEDFDNERGYLCYLEDWDGDPNSLVLFFDRDSKLYYWDMEPDIFYFSTPSESGKFFFSHDKQAHFLNKTANFRLANIPSSDAIELMDAKGIKYQYEDIEETQTYTYKSPNTANTWENGFDLNFTLHDSYGFNESDPITSAWKLSRIILPKGDTISFYYECIKYQLPVQESAVKQTLYKTDGSSEGIIIAGMLTESGLRYTYQKCIIDGKRLSEIRWRGGSILFEAENRDDILSYSSYPNSKAIKAIKVKDAMGNTVKHWLFDYSYFNQNTYSSYPHLFKRLKLQSIKEVILSDSIGYCFNYNEKAKLPAKNTKNTDFWGYYNGSKQDSDYVCPVVIDSVLYTGGDKRTDTLYSRLGMLVSMTCPTGGTTTFTYENNTVTNGEYSELCQNRCCLSASRSSSSSGSPIACDTIELNFRQKVKIYVSAENKDNINTLSGYDFVGTTDTPFELFQLSETGNSTCIISQSMPDYWDNNNGFHQEIELLLNPGCYVMRVESIVDGFTADMEMQYSSLNVYHDGDERFVGGLRIARLDGEKSISYTYSGGTLFKKPVASGFFSAFSLHPYYDGHIIMALQHSESVASLSTISSGQIMGYSDVYENYNDGSRNYYQYHNEAESYFIEGYPLAGTQTDWLNGSLIKRERYGSSDLLNHPKETTSFVYSQPATGDSISGFVFDGGDMINYKNIVRNVLPIKIMQTTQLGNGARSIIYSKGYDENFQCVSDTVANGNDKLVTRNFYPYNLSDSVSIQMVGANIIGSPVAQLKSRNGTIFDGAWTRYGKFDGRILPSQELRLNTDQATANLTSCLFDTIMEYKNYDKYGNPRWMSYRGTPVTCLWGYHGTHPVIEVVGADFSNVQSHLSSGTVSALLDANSINSTQLRSWHNALQVAFQDFSVSACRYVPLVGPSEIIGADGISTTYEYDAAGRLVGKRLHGTDLLQRYTYHYGADNYQTTSSMLDSNASDSILTVQYYDRWGRPSLSASQDKRTDRNFSYSMQTYDFLGRPSRVWNPLPTSDVSPHSMSESAFASASASYYSDTLAFSETTYDALGNIVRVTTPGEAWAGEGRQNTSRYLINGSNEVKRYSITSSGGLGGGSSYYPTGSLLCTEQRDPDGKKMRKYSDIFGNVILERRTDSLETFDTYYVYDALNRLRMALSPKCQESADDMAACRYEYRYNGKGQVIWKRLPGCEPVQYWYDRNGRPVCMQDGMLRSESRYRFFLYDRLGRLCIQGTTPQCYQARQFSCVSQTLQGLSFKDTGYIYQGNPTELNQSNCTLEAVSYYDSYNYLDIPQPVSGVAEFADSLSVGTGRSRLTGTRQYLSNGEAMLTTFAYDDRGRICRTGEFGLNGRLTVTDSRYNFFDGIDKVRTSHYACTANSQQWTGSIMQSYTYHPHTILPHATTLAITNSNGSTSSETIRSLSYDDFGNITGNNRGGTAADMAYTYDLLHGWIKEISSTSGFEQKLYREDNTGHPLYNGSISAMTWKVFGSPQLRRYDYTYDGMNRLTEGAYSHQVAQTPGILQGMGNEPLAMGGAECEAVPLGLIPVIDDPGNPVLPEDNGPDRYTERITYDKNSNITSIERYGMNNQRQYGLIDSLVITRNGNQLKTIEDHAEKHLTYTGASDFYDGCTYSNEYSYNANGALDMDQNRDIDMIMYDRLGNTHEIWFYDHSNIEYIYAADGTKLRTIHRPAGSTALTDSIDYVGNLILKNGHPSMYLFDGGYATFNTNGAVDGWHYYIQDYMGNNRMVVNKNGTKEQITHYYPYGGVIGDISTNESLQKYKFEGKELDRTFGLDNYDIHARQYFSMMPTWDRIDPLAEKYYGISPYVYCGGDPVNRMDVNGDSIQLFGNIFDIVLAIYNAIPPEESFVLSFVGKGVIDPNSIPDSSDPFLQDLKYVAGQEEMVEMRFGSSYEYKDQKTGKIKSEVFEKTPEDYYYPESLKEHGEVGWSVIGNTGVTLFPSNSISGKLSTNSNIQIYVNSKGELNHRSIGIGHELIHQVRKSQGKIYAHPNVDAYLYDRLLKLFLRLGYDFVDH